MFSCVSRNTSDSKASRWHSAWSELDSNGHASTSTFAPAVGSMDVGTYKGPRILHKWIFVIGL